MATYYVTTTGNAANPGTLASPWTLTKAFLSAVAGDTVYIAPGTYIGTFTASNSGSSGNTISFIGDPTASIAWSGIAAGVVKITNITTDNALPTAAVLLAGTSTNYLSFQNIFFEGYGSSTALLLFTTSNNLSFTKCAFQSIRTAQSPEYGVRITTSAGVAISSSFTQCVGNNVRCIAQFFAPSHSSAYNLNITITDCHNVYGGIYWMDVSGGGTSTNAGGITVYNSSSFYDDGIRCYSTNTTHPSYLYNSFIQAPNVALLTSTSGALIENYNRIFGQRFSVTQGANTNVTGRIGLEFGQSLLAGIPSSQMFSSSVGSPVIAAGTASGAPSTDLYGFTWSNTTPDVGSATYKPVTSITGYLPTERNASTITIAPGSTSQSIELYLGATGLTASTSGLSARYNRTRTASVSIPLVARTIAQAWTSGGFAEVDATNMPGVYRLDLPDAALAAGADDVTIVVRGASGTNGAVMTIKLSSGGLTSAQTASAVWDASPAGYNDATTFGGVVNQIDQTVTGIDTAVQDIPSNVWDELKANHTIPNSFGDYLDTKVSTGADTSRIQLRQGPFLIKQNAVDSVITEVNQFLSTVPNIEMVLIDSSGGSVSVAGATLVMRVRNQAGTAVVNNVTPTVAYADGGVIRWSPNLSWTALGVTTAGTYRIVVERTMSGVTTTFGPFLVQLSSG